MFRATRGRPLATTITGSLPRPGWYTANLHGRPFPLAMTDLAYREQYIDALAAFASDQERAGLDVFTDGDARCDMDVAGRSWFAYATERLLGLEGFHPSSPRLTRPGDILFEIHESRVLPGVVGPVRRGPLAYAAVWRAAQRMTARPVKFGAISAQTVERVLRNFYYSDRRELLLDLAAAFNEEFLEVATAGCPAIQVEEPAIHANLGVAGASDPPAEFLVEAFNREVSGLREKTEVWCHTCWGNPAAQRVDHDRLSYARALPYLDCLDVDILTFEAADDDGADLPAIGQAIGKDKKICIGVVSHRTLQVERPEKVANLIRTALKYIEPERLILSSDCGFGRQGMSRLHAIYKMIAIVRGANLVRNELGLDEAPIMAMTPAYADPADAGTASPARPATVPDTSQGRKLE